MMMLALVQGELAADDEAEPVTEDMAKVLYGGPTAVAQCRWPSSSLLRLTHPGLATLLEATNSSTLREQQQVQHHRNCWFPVACCFVVLCSPSATHADS